ncbi:MAG: hypothetical protein AAGJ84_10600 [Pseudomonadota bacterium]
MIRNDFTALGIFRMRPSDRTRQKPSFPLGLGLSGVHEVVEDRFGDLPAAAGFILTASQHGTGPIVHVQQDHVAANHGRILPQGLPGLNHNPPSIITVSARRQRDALWSVEEAILSRAPSLVLGEIEDLDFTASRRLTLAAQRCGVPVILLLPYTREGATAALARWRLSSAPSARNRFDPYAPGATRWRAILERCRLADIATPFTFDLELDHETLSLSVVSELATDPAAARPTERHNQRTPWRQTG